MNRLAKCIKENWRWITKKGNGPTKIFFCLFILLSFLLLVIFRYAPFLIE